MFGHIDENGYDRPPCSSCKHKDKMTVEAPCYNCIDEVDLALHKPNHQTNFANYEPYKGGWSDEEVIVNLANHSTDSVRDRV